MSENRNSRAVVGRVPSHGVPWRNEKPGRVTRPTTNRHRVASAACIASGLTVTGTFRIS